MQAKQFQELVGTEREILFEKVGKNGMVKGRTRCWQNTIVPGGEELVGTLQRVKIHGFSNQTLHAELLQQPANLL